MDDLILENITQGNYTLVSFSLGNSTLTMNNHTINQDLSYGEILTGRPEAWLVKTNILFMHAITKFQKERQIEVQNNFQDMLGFYDIFNGL